MYYNNGKRKKISESLLEGHGTFWNSAKRLTIDTLFVEDTSIYASFFAEKTRMVHHYKIKHIVINGVAYSFDEEETDLSKIEGFQAISIYSERKKPSGQIILSNAIVVDGDDEDYKSYFANSSITKVVLSSKIRKIGKGAFRGCEELREIVFPNGVKNVEIAPDAFAGCMNLDESRIIVPNGRNDIKEAIIKSAALLKNEDPNVPREIKWSSEKNCEVFGIRNCYLYFDKCKYQYFKNGADIVKHGEIECTNGRYRGVYDYDMANAVVNVKGFYRNGLKHGQWYFEHKVIDDNGNVYVYVCQTTFKNDKVDGKFIYGKRKGDEVIQYAEANYIEGKPFGKYTQLNGKTVTIINYDEYGKKTGPMTIITEDEEHYGTFKQDYLYDYYYIDKKTKEKFTPADKQGVRQSIGLLKFSIYAEYGVESILNTIIGSGILAGF